MFCLFDHFLLLSPCQQPACQHGRQEYGGGLHNQPTLYVHFIQVGPSGLLFVCVCVSTLPMHALQHQMSNFGSLIDTFATVVVMTLNVWPCSPCCCGLLQVGDEEVARLILEHQIPAITDIHPQFCDFTFTPRYIRTDDDDDDNTDLSSLTLAPPGSLTRPTVRPLSLPWSSILA